MRPFKLTAVLAAAPHPLPCTVICRQKPAWRRTYSSCAACCGSACSAPRLGCRSAGGTPLNSSGQIVLVSITRASRYGSKFSLMPSTGSHVCRSISLDHSIVRRFPAKGTTPDRWETPSPRRMSLAPAASITRRSKPRATPVAAGRPASMAASSRLSSGKRRLAVGPAQRVVAAAFRCAQLGRVDQLVIAVGQLDRRRRTARTARPPAVGRAGPGPAPPGWPDSRTGSSAARGPGAAGPAPTSSKSSQPSRSSAARLAGAAMPRCRAAAASSAPGPRADRARRARRTPRRS